MDSPVIVDTASKFGRGIDLDSSFPGFPFDEDGFGRRSDIRAHLDDLAARHPEFADHLVGPPWGDIPFHGSLRNRRRGSGSGSSSSYHGHPDEDARSQASGSSAASAASGASGVSSHGEPEPNRQEADRDSRNNPIPNYGLRNTVDIGQHHHNMENFEKDNRGQRSMSAPPENRQNSQPQMDHQTQQPQPGQRFVSRVDITPQHNQQQQPQPQQQQQQKEQKGQQAGNVRHIPIFVEGRDEPVISKHVKDTPFKREPSPTQFQAPPHHFSRSSPFGSSTFGSRQRPWSPHFQDSFYSSQSPFEQPMRRQQQPRQYQEKRAEPQQEYYEQQHPRQQQPRPQQQPKQQQQQKPQAQSPPQQQQQSPQPQEPPRPKPTLPKDPLERVALVQKEVDSLAEQVKEFTGNSRQDKQYMYLDEMLTRELIKLDDIETEGKENVRQARKNAIRTIQETISLLESKAPLPASRQQSVDEHQLEQEEMNSNENENAEHEPMDVDHKEEESKEPIPLPSGPSSPTKKTQDENKEMCATQENDTKNEIAAAQAQESQQEALTSDSQTVNTQSNPMESLPTSNEDATMTDDVQQAIEKTNIKEDLVENRKEDSPGGKNVENASEMQTSTQDPEQKFESEKMEVDAPINPPKAASKTPKKTKKSKKPAPVSEQAIPLPAPVNTEASSK